MSSYNDDFRTRGVFSRSPLLLRQSADHRVSSCLFRLRAHGNLSGKAKVRDPAVIGQYRVVAPPH